MRPVFLPGEPPFSETSQVSHTRKRQKNVRAQGASFTSAVAPERVLTLGGTDVSDGRATAISMLPDDVLIEIFDFYRDDHDYSFLPVWKWHILVHVCQRWRQVVFASPHGLKLQILCTYGTPLRENLGIWPTLPIVLNLCALRPITPNDEDNVIATLEHPHRVHSVKLYVTDLQLGRMVTVMQEPFPVLTRLLIVSRDILSRDRNALVLPAKFLGGSAPCLQKLSLSGVSYPALPTLLLSVSDLVTLRIRDIPPTGYISPETIVACLAALPSLRNFDIEFDEVTSRPDRIRPPPVTRTILPALTSLGFQGASQYLEDLVAQIHSPQTNCVHIEYLDSVGDLQVAELSTFIGRSVGTELTPSGRAYFSFNSDQVTFTLKRHANYSSPDPVGTTVAFEAYDWQVSHMAQLLGQFPAKLFTVVRLESHLEAYDYEFLENTDDVQWPHLFHQFSATQMLHVCRELAGRVALALEMFADVLPSLDLLCLAGEPESSIEKFVAARRLSDRPVTVVDTEEDFDTRLESYISKKKNIPYQLRTL
jgi:hypothetical protein